jgi:hypothetical protein
MHVLVSVQVVDRIADENHHALVGIGLQPIAHPLLEVRPHCLSERGLLVSGDVEDFGGPGSPPSSRSGFKNWVSAGVAGRVRLP